MQVCCRRPRAQVLEGEDEIRNAKFDTGANPWSPAAGRWTVVLAVATVTPSDLNPRFEGGAAEARAGAPAVRRALAGTSLLGIEDSDAVEARQRRRWGVAALPIATRVEHAFLPVPTCNHITPPPILHD